MSIDAFAVFNNPAGLSYIKNRMIGFYYSPSPFALRELASASSTYSENFQSGSISGGVIIYGFDLYRETKIAFGLGKRISQNISVGLTSVYNYYSIKNYGSCGVFTFNLGGIAELSKTFFIGFLAENIFRSSIGKEKDQIPILLNAGISYIADDQLRLFFKLSKELHFEPAFSIGAEFELADFMQLRLGTSNEQDSFSGGLGINFSFVQAEYAVISHPELGFSHQFGIIVIF